MKKIFAMILCLFVVFTVFSACGSNETNDGADTSELTGEVQQNKFANGELAEIKEAGKLLIGMTERPPMNYKDESGEWIGFDTELAKAYAKELGVEAEFVVIDWNNKYIDLESGAIDCIWNGLTLTEEGKANSLISDPYAKDAQVVVMANAKLADYPDVDSMIELSFAVVDGSVGSEAAQAFGYNVASTVNDPQAALSEVASGSVDACIIDIASAVSLTGDDTEYAEYGYEVELSPEEYVVAFRKDSNLTADFNAFIAKALKDGTLDTIAEKYQLTPAK